MLNAIVFFLVGGFCEMRFQLITQLFNFLQEKFGNR